MWSCLTVGTRERKRFLALVDFLVACLAGSAHDIDPCQGSFLGGAEAAFSRITSTTDNDNNGRYQLRNGHSRAQQEVHILLALTLGHISIASCPQDDEQAAVLRQKDPGENPRRSR